MKTFHFVPIGLLLGLSVWAAANTDGRERRLTPTEIAAMPSTGPGAGTSGVGGIRTTVLSGDPTTRGILHNSSKCLGERYDCSAYAS
jgi:hypothetical protein